MSTNKYTFHFIFALLTLFLCSMSTIAFAGSGDNFHTNNNNRPPIVNLKKEKVPRVLTKERVPTVRPAPVDKCSEIACAAVMPNCRLGEEPVNVTGPTDCCPVWVCRATVSEKIPIDPLKPHCPDAPAVMRQCKSGAEPSIETITDDQGCTISLQKCPEDELSAPTQQIVPAGSDDKKQKDKKRSKGNVIQ
jgi:hypothetical protein